ncbi:MAG: tRNA pseudouridine(38-40) synthase TruA [Phycisphaerae bacterium]|nr:tRNA pseudouridine(38-40) synthase TruA [Phycisphaerae bacterium]
MPRTRLVVAYDGTNFHGWQRQEPPNEEPLRTVQGVLSEAVVAVIRQPTRVVGASRTDAGVHARGQVAAFSAAHGVPFNRLAEALNARLPPDVRVMEARPAPENFDPISWCTSKCYRYQIAHGSRAPDLDLLFERRTVWQTWHRLDVARMQAAASLLTGTHDFAGFAQASHKRQTSVRTVHGCHVWQTRPGRITIEVAGNGFLYNMVRIIAGTLVEVGRGRLEPSVVTQALRTPDRSLVGPTLPPKGLRLEWAAYDEQRRANASEHEVATDEDSDAE